MTQHQPITGDDRTDVQITMSALLLYAVRGDCNASLELVELADREILNRVAHHMAHLIATIAVKEHGAAAVEAQARDLLDRANTGRL